MLVLTIVHPIKNGGEDRDSAEIMETIKMKYDDETLPGVWCAVDIRDVNES